MIKTSDAATITLPGRAYLQVGNNEVYELFQSAYSGAPYEPTESTKPDESTNSTKPAKFIESTDTSKQTHMKLSTDSEKANAIEAQTDEDELVKALESSNKHHSSESSDNRVYIINNLGQGELINKDLGGSLESNQIKKTQLEAVIDYLSECFDDMKLEKVGSPWLPPLDELLVSPKLSKINLIDSASYVSSLNLQIPIGVEDLPHMQQKKEHFLDFATDGNVLYVASPGYGKSVFLETVILSLCTQNSVTNLNIYILDFGNNTLMPLSSLPHVADYITYDDVEKQNKVMTLLKEELKIRKSRLSKAKAQSFEVYNQISKDKLKAMVIILDNYDVVKESVIEEDFLKNLARDGISLGMYLVITATRTNAIKYSVYNQIKTKIAGYTFDALESRAMVGKGDYDLTPVKGRTLIKTDRINLMQIYSPVEYETALDYSKNLIDLIELITRLSTEQKAKGIAVLPEQFDVDMLDEYKRAYEADIYLGLDKQDVMLHGIDTSDTPFLIVGPVRSGKSNAASLILSYIETFEQVYIFNNAQYELQGYRRRAQVRYMDEGERIDEWQEEIEELIRDRKEKYRQSDKSVSYKEFYSQLEKQCIFINDIEQFSKRISDSATIINTILTAATTGIFVVICTQSRSIPSRGECAKLIKAAQNGLILGDYGINTSFPTIKASLLPTHIADGILVKRGECVMIRLPKGDVQND